MQPALLIYNPKSGGWRNRQVVEAVIAELEADGPAIEARSTAGPDDATRLARRASERGAPLVFVLGGDGTIREAAAGLLGGASPLAPLPGGTTNVIVRTLGLPLAPLAAARALKQLSVREFDVGLCGDKPFLMQASMGLDAQALYEVSALGKRFLGRSAVLLAGLGAWWRYDYPEFDLLIDGHTVSASFAAVCNLPLYAGSLELLPGARPDDGQLDVLLFRGSDRRATLDFARDLIAGRHMEREDVSVLAASEVVLTDPDVPLQIDGDPVPALLGTEIRLAGTKLRILAPSTIMAER